MFLLLSYADIFNALNNRLFFSFWCFRLVEAVSRCSMYLLVIYLCCFVRCQECTEFWVMMICLFYFLTNLTSYFATEDSCPFTYKCLHLFFFGLKPMSHLPCFKEEQASLCSSMPLKERAPGTNLEAMLSKPTEDEAHHILQLHFSSIFMCQWASGKKNTQVL